MTDKHSDILGVYPGHDATVVLIRNGKILEAMSEERFSRVKKHMGFPYEALAYIRKKYGVEDLKKVYLTGLTPLASFLETPNLNSRNKQIPRQWMRRVSMMQNPLLRKLLAVRDSYTYNKGTLPLELYKSTIQEQFPNARLTFLDHHLSHAWASLPFMNERKPHLVLTLDGEGDGLSGSINIFDGRHMEVKHAFKNSQSLGLLYCAVVDILGMKRNEHEFKVMGLAPYAKASSGEKVYEELRTMLWFNSKTMQIETTIDTAWATPELLLRDFTTRHRFDSIAYGIQKLTEEVIKDIARAAIEKYGIPDLAIGGGVFMNVKANQYLAALPEVASVVVTPSCGDESLALGAAVYGYGIEHGWDFSELQPLTDLYLGSEYSDEEVRIAIDTYGKKNSWTIRYYDTTKGELIEKEVARLLAENSVVGRFKGRAEWGARALGNRSILANPTSRDNVKLINEMIKGRDFWMPFATSMLYERRNDYLINPRGIDAPYMAITFDTTPRAHTELIAALHPYDLTSRPQLVTRDMNPSYHALIQEFELCTGIGGILNTSFNLHGEPNVEKPEDAIRTFDLSGLPHVAIGNYLISKK